MGLPYPDTSTSIHLHLHLPIHLSSHYNTELFSLSLCALGTCHELIIRNTSPQTTTHHLFFCTCLCLIRPGSVYPFHSLFFLSSLRSSFSLFLSLSLSLSL